MLHGILQVLRALGNHWRRACQGGRLDLQLS